MTDNDAIVKRESAPEHLDGFWARVDSELGVSSSESTGPATATRELPRVVSGQDREVVPMPSGRDRRRVWPIAAAAALFAFVGLGFLATQRSTDPGTEVAVAAEPTAEASITQQPAGEGSPDEASTPSAPAAADAADDGSQTAVPDQEANGQAAGGADEPTSVAAAPAIPEFSAASGAVGEPDYVPLDQGLPSTATFLANWPERGLTWYAVSDEDRSCADADFSEIWYVNGAGLTLATREPQLRFSGEVSHFVLNESQSHAAWVVGCGTQLELYVGELLPTGEIDSLTLAWLGTGTPESALVLWDDNSVDLNAIEPGATAFAVSYSLNTKLVSRNGGPSRIMLEAGAPAARSLTPIAASADGALTYWTGAAPAGTISQCPELYGSGQSDTLWLRSGEGQWQLAAGDEYPLGTVTAAALEPDRAQIAFADLCPAQSGRVLIGVQQADGTIAGIRSLDLAPYIPGFASQLHWVDPFTLRIETDNTEFGFDRVRFDVRLAEDPDDIIVVQLD